MRVIRAWIACAALVSISTCSASADAPTRHSGSQQSVPTAPQPGHLAVGETATYSIVTHCGVEHANINGRWWNAVTPLYGSDPATASAPAGWDDPWQSGELTLESAERAVFRARGQQVVLEPSEAGQPGRICP